MTTRFWRVLERLGATGSAARDWQAALGDDWEAARALLRAVPGTAETVAAPNGRGPRMLVVSDGEAAYLGIDDDVEAFREPVPLTADEVAVLRPDWGAISRELGTRLGFVAEAWESDGLTRQIGIAQRGSDLPRPVVLHLPGGHLGDMPRLLRDLGRRDDAIVLLPSATWLTPDVQNLQRRNRLTFITLAEHFEATAGGRPTFPISTAMQAGAPASAKRRRPALHPQPGWRWDMVRIEVATGGRLILSCDGQRNEFRFPKTSRKIHSQGYAIMMRVAVNQEWRNPPSDDAEHDKVRTQFRRLGRLLTDLVPLPGKPFRRHRGRFLPVFQVALHADLASRAPSGC